MPAPAKLLIDWCGYDAASYAVKHWHYSRAMPTGKLVKVGVWEDDEFIGCVLFGRGNSPHLGTKYKFAQTEICELTRVALRAHKTPVSRIGAIAVRLLRRECPGLRLVVSFADPEKGHHGGIYQAMGWTYTGQSAPTLLYFWRGKWRHTRSVAGRNVEARLRKLFVRGDLAKKEVPGKHRYLLPLDEATAAIAKELAQPYPKRETSSAPESVSSSSTPRREGGSTPTLALQASRG